MRRIVSMFGLLLVTLLGAAGASAQTASTPAPPLSPATEAAIYPVIDYAQILDASKPSPAKLSRYTSACRKLTPGTRLVAAYRAVCRSEGDAFTAALRLPNCRSAARCQARLTRYARDAGLQIAASRRLNTALKAVVTDTDCRGALRISSAVLSTLGRLQRAATSLAKTIPVGTPAQVSAGVGRFYAIDRAPLLDHRGRLDQFRAACR